MVDFVRTLPIVGANPPVVGSGNDSLTVINNVAGGVWVTDFTTNPDGSVNGIFDGPGGNNIVFYNIRHLGYVDNAGYGDRIRSGGGGGNDTILAGGGDDTIYSGAGIDSIDGGDGVDR